MRTFTKQELEEILDNHKLWLSSGGKKGERADLSSADLRNADLSNADLSSANLSFTDLSSANLSSAILNSANLSSADLRSANLRSANLSNANLDFSAFPLWCGGLNVNIDYKIAIQLLYHFVRNVKSSPYTSKQLKSLCKLKSIIKQADKFHRVGECGIIEED